MYQVQKRDGKVTDFDISKITAAISKAFDALEKQYHPSTIDLLALNVTAHFEPKIKSGIIDVEDIQEILIVDSTAAAVGGFIGASSITTYVESTSGAAAGARTVLSNIVIGVLFAICAFFAPVIGMVGGSATCGALVVVGYLMLCDVTDIDWAHIENAFPAFITIVGIPMTYSITNGIGLGFIFYCFIMVALGRAKEVKPLMWVAAVAFLVMFIFA